MPVCWLVCWGAGCAFPYTVRNVGAGKTALNLSVGGQMVDNLGAPLPVPAVVAGGQHGLTEAWDVHGSFHLLAALYKMMGIDMGATRRLLREQGWIPEVTASLRLSMLTNFSDGFRIYPELESYASYLLARRWLVFFGITTLYDFFWPKDSHVRVHWGPCLGAEVRFARRYSAGLALRWVSPQQETDRVVVGYVGGQGMLSIQLGFKVNLGTWGEGSQ